MNSYTGSIMTPQEIDAMLKKQTGAASTSAEVAAILEDQLRQQTGAAVAQAEIDALMNQRPATSEPTQSDLVKALLGGERPKFGEEGYAYKPFLRNRLIEPKVEGPPRDEDHPDVVLEGNPLTGNYQYRNNPRPKRGGGGW